MNYPDLLRPARAIARRCGLLFAMLLVSPAALPQVGAPAGKGNARSLAEAQALADSFWPKTRGGGQVEQKMAYAEQDSAADHPYYYVFNRGDNQGFIVISADSRTKKVLAYSDEGSFDIDKVPDQMRAWMRGCKDGLNSLDITPDSLLNMDLSQLALTKSKARETQTFAREIRPLLGTINYAQNFPYNNTCPVVGGQRCVTGCVATGAATIMRYYKYPTAPTGKTHSYTLNGRTISTTYNTAYDWGNMPTAYKGLNPTAAQQSAVAKLMYDAGVGCSMSYGPNESSANTGRMAEQMVRLFGYDKGLTEYRRSWFNPQEFVYYIKRELNSGRPVLMAGWGAGGGHCFVCDGYDANGLFHINWGWDGQSNGYFALDNLNPSALGTGGGTGGGFSNDVYFWGGLQPPVEGSTKIRYLAAKSFALPLNVNKGQNFTVTFHNLENFHPFDKYVGLVGCALYKGGKQSRILGSTSIDVIGGNYFAEYNVSCRFPTDIAAGDYQLVLVAKYGDDKWRPVLCGTTNTTNVSIAGGRVSMQFDTGNHVYDLPKSPSRPESVADDVHGSETGPTAPVPPTLAKAISVDIDGSGNMSVAATLQAAGGGYNGRMAIFLYDRLDGSTPPVLLNSQTVALGSQASRSIFDGVATMDPGNHYALLFYANVDHWAQVPPFDLSVVEFSVGSPTTDAGGEDDGGWWNLVDDADGDLLSADDFYSTGSDIPTGDVAPGERGGGTGGDGTKSHYTLNDVLNMSDDEIAGLLDDLYGTTGEESVAARGTEVCDFSGFRMPAARRGAGSAGGLLCSDLRLRTAAQVDANGKEAASLRRGQPELVQATVRNGGQAAATRVLTLSLFDSRGLWVADLAEQRVTVAAGASSEVLMPVLLTNVDAGPYMLRLTQAEGDDDTPRPMEPAPQASKLLQVTL